MSRFDNYFELINTSTSGFKTVLVRLICNLKTPRRLKKIRQRILSHPKEVNIRVNGVRPLEIVCRNTRALGINVAKLLLEHGAKVNVTADMSRHPRMPNPLLLASLYSASDSNLEMVQLLLRYGADPDITSKNEMTTLMCVVKYFVDGDSDIRVISMLLDAGADINHTDINGCTTMTWLMRNIHKRNVKLVSLLLNYRPNLTIIDRYGQNTLMACVINLRSKYMSVLIELLDYDSSSINQSDARALTTIDNANKYQVINILLAYGAKPNDNVLFDYIGHRNAGALYTIKALIRHGAKLDALDDNGMAPLLTAVQCDDIVMVKLLLKHGADPDCEDSHGCTTLSYVLQSSHYINQNRTAKLLIAAGADITHVNHAGKCALNYLDYSTDLGKEILQLIRSKMN